MDVICPGVDLQMKYSERSFKKASTGVPLVAQWLTNPTGNHEVLGLIPGLAQWVKALALL